MDGGPPLTPLIMEAKATPLPALRRIDSSKVSRRDGADGTRRRTGQSCAATNSARLLLLPAAGPHPSGPPTLIGSAPIRLHCRSCSYHHGRTRHPRQRADQAAHKKIPPCEGSSPFSSRFDTGSEATTPSPTSIGCGYRSESRSRPSTGCSWQSEVDPAGEIQLPAGLSEAGVHAGSTCDCALEYIAQRLLSAAVVVSCSRTHLG